MKHSSIASLVLSAFLCFCGAAFGGDTTGRASFSADDLTWNRVAGLDIPSLGDAGLVTQAGAPALPVVQVNVAIPPEAFVTEVNLLSVEKVEIAGTFNVAPMTMPRRVGAAPPPNPFVKDEKIYGRNAFFPGKYVEKTSQWDLAGQDFVTLTLYPVQYNPVLGKVVLAQSISYEVVYREKPGAVRETYNLSDITGKTTLERLKSLAANPEDVVLPPWDGGGDRGFYQPKYEYIIITPLQFMYCWDALIEWLTQKGMPAFLVPTEIIYNTCAGSADQEKIRSFIIDAHSIWGTTYFLLGGDTSKIPCHVWNPASDAIPNDTYYADYDDDWVVEVHVGRASVENGSDIEEFIDKSISYQKNPPPDFCDTYFLMGYDLDSSTPSENCMVHIADYYIPAGADLSTEYDSEPGTHYSDTIGYLNDGQNLICHSDHCGSGCIGVGCVNHGHLLYPGDFNGLQNGEKKGLFYSIGCWSLAYDYNDSIGEVWTQNNSGAGLAYVGNSRYGWYAVGHSNLYSLKYAQLFFKVLCGSPAWCYTAGAALTEHKNEFYPGGLYQYIYQELTLMGDPGLPLWTEDPITVNVLHQVSIGTGTQDFDVLVRHNGQNYAGALVCIWKGSEVYERGNSAVDGLVHFYDIDPATSGLMKVTVTGKNILPYEGKCLVSQPGDPEVFVDLEMNDSIYYFGDDISYTIDMYNATALSQAYSLWTNVTIPNGATWPPSGHLNGPKTLTLDPKKATRISYEYQIPVSYALAGLSTMNAYVGSYPTVDHEDHEEINVVP